MRVFHLRSILLIVLVAATSARAATLHDESVDGDLSGDRLAPNSFALAAGSNNLIGNVVGGDLDYVTINVPAGHLLAEIQLVSFASLDAIAFVGMQAGSTMTVDPAAPNPADLLGYTHFGPGGAPAGSDLLDDIGQGAGSQGFTPPLPAGAYTLWIQQLGPPTDYNFDFVVQPVPEPTSISLAGIASALVLIGTLRRRVVRRRRRS